MASVCSDLASLRRWRSIRPPAPTAASNDQGKINKTKIILSAQKRCAPNHHCSRSTQPSGQAAGCISASVATDLPTLACYQPKSSPARLPPFGGQTVTADHKFGVAVPKELHISIYTTSTSMLAELPATLLHY